MVLIEHHVFQHRAKAQRLEDVRLALGRQIDRLGVAAAFDVEDAVVAPAMLVVADEMALGVGGQRRLARAAEAEEQRRRAGLFVGRGRAVHREHSALRRQVVRDGEDALLHLAGVFGAEDDELLVLNAEIDARRRAHAGGELVGGKCARIDNDELRLAETCQFLLRGADEHGVHEERVIRPRADDADLDAILRIPAREAVEAIKPLPRVEIIEGALAVDCEGVCRRTGCSPAPTRCRSSSRDARPPACLSASARSLRRSRRPARRSRRCWRLSRNEWRARRARSARGYGGRSVTVRPWVVRSNVAGVVFIACQGFSIGRMN